MTAQLVSVSPPVDPVGRHWTITVEPFTESVIEGRWVVRCRFIAEDGSIIYSYSAGSASSWDYAKYTAFRHAVSNVEETGSPAHIFGDKPEDGRKRKEKEKELEKVRAATQKLTEQYRDSLEDLADR